MDIKAQILEVQDKHKGLSFDSSENTLEGELFLPDGDSYDVSIKLDPYPAFFPTVFETGGRIPIKMDRHMYTDSGSCCFTTLAKSQVLLKTQITSLLKFIDEIIIRYFENNSYYEINGKYCYDEYDHGSKGIVQSYQDILDTDNIKSIIKLMFLRLKNIKLSHKDPCYCNSGQSLKKCTNGEHWKNYKLFRMINKALLYSDIYHFEKLIDNK